MLRYSPLVLFATLLFIPQIQAQEITRVALLDYNKVLLEFPQQSRDLQLIKDLKAKVAEEMARLKDQVMQLQEDLTAAESKGDESQIRQLQNEISKQRDYGRKYVESKNEEIEVLQKKAANGHRNSEMQQILADILSQVAREQGYSIILDVNTQNIIWFHASIDITEEVIQLLKKRLSD